MLPVNQPPRRPRPFNPQSQNGLPNHAKHQQALAHEGAQQAREQQAVRAQSVGTASSRKLPALVHDAVEVQAYMLRKEGWHYGDICRVLEVGHETARLLVAEGAKRCVDEDPMTSLRLYLGRIEGLVQEWYTRAFVKAGEARDPRSGLRVDPEATARENGKFLLQILGLQDKIGVWLASLPRRGQEVKDEDDHAEIKAILMRAEEYGPPLGHAGTPHGMPSLADWRPADVESEDG